jgi:fructose transport system ATP-binding protein
VDTMRSDPVPDPQERSRTPAGGAGAPVLAAADIAKSYGQVQALRGVDLELAEGEILALVGDNGAGKSTLIKILSGAVQPDAGEIRVDGAPVSFPSPIAARAHGIETVHQDLAVVPMLDVAENLFLGREERLGGRRVPFIAKRRMRRAAEAQLQHLKIRIGSVRQRVETLSGGQRQAVAVARAPMFGRRVVILDEPTAALGVKETAAVTDLIRLIREQGMAIILISHNMPQVLELSDRIMVLRAGRRVGVLKTAQTDMEQIVRFITGAEVH